MKTLTDLREILRYVPGFRERIFIIAIDGEIVEDERFGNLLLDVALLRSLSVQVVLVHGAGFQLRRLASELNQPISNSDGTGVTDEATLRLALTVSNRITHEILEGLLANDLRAAYSNAVIAHPAGILRGVDMRYTGRVERVDTVLLKTLLDHGVVPVVPPLGFDGEGRTYRVNSDAIAAHLALELKAIKLVYLTTIDGIELEGRLLRQLPVAEAEAILKSQRERLAPQAVSKLEYACKACQGGIPRVHIINGRLEEGLLAEAFSPEGVGTLIHINEYESIRPAAKKDARTIQRLIASGVANEELMKRTRGAIEKQIGDYLLFEIDRNPAGCVALHGYAETGQAELACLAVDANYENRGIGRKLVAYVEQKARERGFRQLFCLSTQTFTYFQNKAGFREASPEALPPARRLLWEQSRRNSRVLVKDLFPDPAPTALLAAK